MDFASSILTGLVACLFTLLGAFLSWNLLKARAISLLEQEISGFLLEIVEQYAKQPEKLVPVIKPAIMALIADISKDFPKGSSNLGDMAGIGMNFLPAKWRGIGQIAMMFLNRKQPQQESTSSNTTNPFG